MSKNYIAFELKAIEVHAPAAARAAGVNEDRVFAGCVRTWHRCFSTKSDQVTRMELAGLFGGADLDTLIGALEVAFLERHETHWRVRGAERYLRIKASQSAAGKAHAGNLRRGKTPGSVPAPPPAHPETSSGSCTEHRTPNTEHREEKIPPPQAAAVAEPHPPKPKKAKAEKPPDPRHAPLVAKLTEASQRIRGVPYAFTPRDARAVSDLLPKGTDEEILAAWERALKATGFPLVRALHELATHWNHFATDRPPPGSAFVKPNRGPIDPNTQQHDPKGGRIAF